MNHQPTTSTAPTTDVDATLGAAVASVLREMNLLPATASEADVELAVKAIRQLKSDLDHLKSPKLSGNPTIDRWLMSEDPAFWEMVRKLPQNYWARYDLSALHIGWSLGRAALSGQDVPVQAPEG
ncbi:MAG: hypothetical protein E6R08_10200 [Nevskiaceae bacterium]|nr:MAG: hypothetical protein E6R08_10200 [Nevskiaceae bacterium]